MASPGPHPPIPADEAGRLRALEETRALDAPRLPELDRIVGLAARLTGAQSAVLNLVAADRQWAKAAVGPLLEHGAQDTRANSFCAHTINQPRGRALVVEDARLDERFAGNPAIEAGVVFYAGCPLVTLDGHALGALCVVDPGPRAFSEDDVEVLRTLAEAAAAQLELSRRTSQAERTAKELRNVLDLAPDAFVAMDLDGIVTDWNDRATALFGWSRDEAVGRRLSELIVPGHLREAHEQGVARFRTTGVGTVLGRPLELPAVTRDGRTIDIELTIAAVDDHCNAFARDISDRKRAEQERGRLVERLRELSRTDELTGAMNRRTLTEELGGELDRARRTGRPLSVVMLDLDHFKAYNDAHGHSAGDRLLKASAVAWRAELRATDVLARYGGEEFVVLLPDCTPGGAAQIASRLGEVIPDDGTCSAGVAVWDGSEDADALLDRADVALYAAKEAGRDTVRVAPSPVLG